VGILHVNTDLVLEKTGVFPSPDQPAALEKKYLTVATVYRNIFNVFGGWLTLLAWRRANQLGTQ
jgi:hypothetical protein